MPATDVRLLGPVEVTLDGRPVALGASKQRAVLAMLALRPNEVVSVDELVDGLWGEEPPASAIKLIQHYVSQLRKLLAGGDAEIVTRGRGYQLRVRPDAVDVAGFERLAEAAARGQGSGTTAHEALSLWRGSPLIDVIDEPFAAQELRRLEELWLNVTEQAIAADLEGGRHEEVVARLDELVGRHPLRERLHALRMRALYGAGRQAEALEAFRQARSILVEEVGVEPGPELQRLHEAVLRQDPELAPARAPRSRPSTTRRFPRALLVAAAAAVLAGGVAFAVSRITAPDSLDGIDENAVGRIDTADANLVAQYLVSREPRALAVGSGSVWVADVKDETVSRLEPSRNRVVTVAVGSDPVALAFGDGALWVAERGDGTVARISPASNKVTRRIQIVNAPSALAVGHGSVWVGSAVDKTVLGVRADGSENVIHLGAPPSAIAIGAGAVWITSEETGTLFRVEPRTGTVVRAIRVGNRPVAVAAGQTGVWVVNRQDATVWRIDPATNSVSDTITVGRDPAAIALSASDVWVATGNGQVSRIDRRAGRIAATIELGNPPTALAADGESVWVATQPTAAHHRGGTLIVGEGAFPYAYLEAGAYEPQAQHILSLAYDGLIAYRRTGGTTFGPLVANLAADVPEPSADGTTYVFTLRRGIRFSNGAALEPEDFRASLEDLLRRHGTRLPTYFGAIIGAQRCVRRPRACDLSSGIVTDPRERTITVRLTRPDPYLLYKLASPLAYIAPAEQPFRPDQEPPGTGPYRVDDFHPERGVELSRNPYFRVWSQDARPDGLADRILVRVSDDPREQLAALERGDLDVVTLADAFGASVPSNVVEALFARYPERLHTSATPRQVAAAAAFRAHVRYLAGRLAAAEADARLWLEEPAMANWPIPSAVASAALVFVLVERGRLDVARRALDAFERSPHDPEAPPSQPLRTGRAYLLAAEGKPQAALQTLRECERFERDWQAHAGLWVAWRSQAALCQLALGDQPEACRLADEELALARVFGAERAIGVALRAHALVHDADQAALTEAIEKLANSGARLEQARAMIDLGSAIRRAGKRADARATLAEGADLAHRCGAKILVDHARAEMRLAGARPRRIAQTGRDALTPAELRVAELAAQGDTNKQIAQALFVTLRTVEMHLSNSYRKLDIETREHLPAALGDDEAGT